MIRIRSRGIVVGIVRRADAQAARHAYEIGDANLGARIAGRLPFGDGGGLPQVIRTLLDEHSHECGGHALAHGPTLERRVRRDALCIPFGDDAASPGHNDGRRHSLGRGKGCVQGLNDLASVEFRWVAARDFVARRPCLCRRVGKRRFDRLRRELKIHRANGKSHAALIADVLGDSHGPAGDGDADCFCGAIDDRFAEFRAFGIGRGEVADVLGSEVGVEAGNEHGGAHDLREARGMMLQRIARGRHVGSGEFQGLVAGEHGIE